MSSAKGMLFASVDAPPRIGGVSLLASRLSASLSKECLENAVFVGPKGTHFEERATAFKVYVDYQSDTTLRAGPGSEIEDERIADLFVKIAKNYELEQIIVWHPFYYAPGAIIAARALGIPVGVYVHGTELTSQIPLLSEPVEPFSQDVHSSELSHRLAKTLTNADIVFTNSLFTRDLVQQITPNGTVVATGCGIDAQILARELSLSSNTLSTSKIARRERLGLPEMRTFIMVGRLVPHKNHAAALRLLSHMPDSQLIIVGDGPELQKLKTLSQNLGIQERVRFCGSTSDADKWQLLRASDAGFLVSNFHAETGGYEGFGITALEYAAAGCLPISNGRHGMADFFDRYKAGLLIGDEEKAAEANASKILNLLSNEEELRNKIAHAREVIATRFTWHQVSSIISQEMSKVS